MPLVVGGTTIKTLKVNSTTCKTGICNGVTIFTSEVPFFQNGTFSNGATGWSESGNLNGNTGFNRPSMTSGEIRVPCVDAYTPTGNTSESWAWLTPNIDLTNYSSVKVYVRNVRAGIYRLYIGSTYTNIAGNYTGWVTQSTTNLSGSYQIKIGTHSNWTGNNGVGELYWSECVGVP